MTKQEFISNYVTNFLASFSAEQFKFFQKKGTWNGYDLPIEDAFTLAGKAWSELQSHINRLNNEHLTEYFHRKE